LGQTSEFGLPVKSGQKVRVPPLVFVKNNKNLESGGLSGVRTFMVPLCKMSTPPRRERQCFSKLEFYYGRIQDFCFVGAPIAMGMDHQNTLPPMRPHCGKVTGTLRLDCVLTFLVHTTYFRERAAFLAPPFQAAVQAALQGNPAVSTAGSLAVSPAGGPAGNPAGSPPGCLTSSPAGSPLQAALLAAL